MGAEVPSRLNTSVASSFLDLQVTGKIILAAGVYEVSRRHLIQTFAWQVANSGYVVMPAGIFAWSLDCDTTEDTSCRACPP
jgi:hypothetical protein